MTESIDGRSFSYVTKWNHRLREPILDEKWLTVAEARDRFINAGGGFEVLDGSATEGAVSPFLLEIPSAHTGWLAASRFNAAGSVVVTADFRPLEGRHFCSRVISWAYDDDDEVYRGMSGSTSITTATFEPDGSGTLTVKDKLDPSNSLRMESRDIPVGDNWLEPLEFGRWEPLLESPVLIPIRPAGSHHPA